jgi:Ca2+-binding EF-hand superfamily protein
MTIEWVQRQTLFNPPRSLHPFLTAPFPSLLSLTQLEKVLGLEELGHLSFDPKFAAHHHEDNMDSEDLGYDYELNDDSDSETVTSRVTRFFPLIDTDNNGFITVDELWKWQLHNAYNISVKQSRQEFHEMDADKDGHLVWQREYAHYLEIEDPVDASDDHLTLPQVLLDIAHGQTGPDKDAQVSKLYGNWGKVTKIRFLLADADMDLRLNEDEYFKMMHPEEGGNMQLKMHTLRQDIHDCDNDDDMHLNFEEFYNGVWPNFFLWNEDTEDEHGEEMPEHQMRENAMNRFTLMDNNADGLLSVEELFPAFTDMHPTEGRYARLEAERMVSVADENEDGKLSLHEMLERPFVFYSRLNLNGDHDEL